MSGIAVVFPSAMVIVVQATIKEDVVEGRSVFSFDAMHGSAMHTLPQNM